jgi:hypothetical protein
MTDAAIITASYGAEKSYTHNLDNVIDSSDAVGAWGTAKESTTELVDLSGNGNIAAIKGPMPTEGFIQGRRFTAANSNYLDCGNDSSLNNLQEFSYMFIMKKTSAVDGYIADKSKKILWLHTGKIRFDIIGVLGTRFIRVASNFSNDKISVVCATYSNITDTPKIYVDGVECVYGVDSGVSGNLLDDSLFDQNICANSAGTGNWFDGVIYFSEVCRKVYSASYIQSFFNTLARLPFWSVNYTDYPDNVIEYTDNLPYSSSIINSGTFKVDDDKLQCVSAGTMTYSASYEFDGSEYIKITIDGVEYAGTGTITQGNTTVSVAQGSNKVTIEMGTGDTIEDIQIQFREEV